MKRPGSTGAFLQLLPRQPASEGRTPELRLGFPPMKLGGSVRVLPAGVALVISHRITSFQNLPASSVANADNLSPYVVQAFCPGGFLRAMSRPGLSVEARPHR